MVQRSRVVRSGCGRRGSDEVRVLRRQLRGLRPRLLPFRLGATTHEHRFRWARNPPVWRFHRPERAGGSWAHRTLLV